MRLSAKLILVFLVVSLIPTAVVGVTANQSMTALSEQSQHESAASLERQVTDELNNSLEARAEEIENLLNERRADVKSLAGTAAVADYYSATSGESTAARETSARRLGNLAVAVHDTVESTVQTILAERYDGRSWEELTPEERRAVETAVERRLAGTAGNGTTDDGTLSGRRRGRSNDRLDHADARATDQGEYDERVRTGTRGWGHDYGARGSGRTARPERVRRSGRSTGSDDRESSAGRLGAGRNRTVQQSSCDRTSTPGSDCPVSART